MAGSFSVRQSKTCLSPEHHNYPNYYHHRDPRSPYDIDRSPVWYVQKPCDHYCEPAYHPPRFALSFHGVRRVGDSMRSLAVLLKATQIAARQSIAEIIKAGLEVGIRSTRRAA